MEVVHAAGFLIVWLATLVVYTVGCIPVAASALNVPMKSKWLEPQFGVLLMLAAVGLQVVMLVAVMEHISH